MKKPNLKNFMTFFIKTSSNLYLFWNFGSLLSIMVPMQIAVGLILSMSYFNQTNNMYFNSFFIFYNSNYGWIMRFMHSNLTSMIFIVMFIHMARSLIYKNFLSTKMWNSGIPIMLLFMAISFLGYSLINSQMAFWASMVITNFVSTIPIIGPQLMLLIWGNRFIDNILLNRFFSAHFMLALLTMVGIFIHMIILHNYKSNNPLTINNKIDQINLNPNFIIKDMIIMMFMLIALLIINCLLPNNLNNPDNFNQMMIFKTPTHIEPEWYFLFFYSILRSINDKFTGLMIMGTSLITLSIIPTLNKYKIGPAKFIMLNKILFMIMIMIMLFISFIGSKPTKLPYSSLAKMLMFMYFFSFPIMHILSKINLMI